MIEICIYFRTRFNACRTLVLASMLFLSTATHVQAQSFISPIDWITSKIGVQDDMGSEIAVSDDNQTVSKVENKYVLKVSSNEHLQILKDEAYTLYGEPSKSEDSVQVWFLPVTHNDTDRVYITRLAIEEGQSGKAHVVVKKMSRKKSARKSKRSKLGKRSNSPENSKTKF